MGKTCGDCIYCGTSGRLGWQDEEHWNKQTIDVVYDKPSCGYFKEDSDGCCYYCTYFKS